MLDSKQQALYLRIETMVQTQGIDYIDAVLVFCEQNGLDVEAVGDLISKNEMLRERIREQAEGLNYLKKTNRLPA